jgi:DNA-binding beta-propeller fold protein YncE
VNCWYASFHGGDKPSDCNNIHVYGIDGKHQRKALDPKAAVKLRELRGFIFGPDGDLYVLNSYFQYSQVLRFDGKLNAANQHELKTILTQPDPSQNPALNHPFGLVFDSSGDLLVSNQNSNSVTRYAGPEALHPGETMPAIQQNFAPGTFIASSERSPHGLHSVRDILFGPEENFYVADRDLGAVRVYDTGGNFKHDIPLQGGQPIHLSLSRDKTSLLIGDAKTEGIWIHDFDTQKTRLLISARNSGLKNPAGMDFGPEGLLYVASRTKRQLFRFDASGTEIGGAPFQTKLPDDPEFIKLVSLPDS